MMAMISFGDRRIKGVHRATNRKAALLLTAFLWCAALARCAAAASGQATLDPVPWQRPHLIALPDAVRVIVRDPPGGVVLARSLPQPGRYRLVVEGRGGPMTMRLRLDDGDYEYLPAPNGTFRRTVAGFRLVEVLIYSDTAAAYDLVSARVEPCPECRTADDLIARIRSAIAGLDTMSPIDRIEALMNWSASVSDYSRSPSYIPSDFEQWDESDALFDFFGRNIGGVSCGGMAVFFRPVLHRFGIDPFTINYGVPDSRVTHVSVVVPFGDDFLLMDPTFAITYRRNGSPLSITDRLGLIRAGKTSLVETRMNGTIERDAIVPADWCRQGPASEASVATEEHLSCGLRLSTLFARFASEQGAAWTGAGAPLTDLPLLRLMLQGVFHVGPGLRPESRRRFIAQLREVGIRFHNPID